MGLFMNDGKHARVFKNKGQLFDNNQAEFRSDYLAEFIKEQQAANALLHRTIRVLKRTQTDGTVRQLNKWRVVDRRLGELNGQQQQAEQRITDRLERLEAQNKDLQSTAADEQQEIKKLLDHMEQIRVSYTKLEQQLRQIAGSHGKVSGQLEQQAAVNGRIVERLDQHQELNREISRQLEQFSLITDEMLKRLEELSGSNAEVKDKMDEQHALQHTMANQISTIEETQKELVGRVEGHEGVMDKLIRQIDHLRSVLYERTSFLEEKIEKVYEYFNQLSTKN